MTRVSDDVIHELLNGGLGELKAEVVAALDSEEPRDRATLSALSGIEPKALTKPLSFLVKHCLARRLGDRDATWILDPGALDAAEAIRRLPKGAKQQAADPDVRAAARTRIERRRKERRTKRRTQ